MKSGNTPIGLRATGTPGDESKGEEGEKQKYIERAGKKLENTVIKIYLHLNRRMSWIDQFPRDNYS